MGSLGIPYRESLNLMAFKAWSHIVWTQLSLLVKRKFSDFERTTRVWEIHPNGEFAVRHPSATSAHLREEISGNVSLWHSSCSVHQPSDKQLTRCFAKHALSQTLDPDLVPDPASRNPRRQQHSICFCVWGLSPMIEPWNGCANIGRTFRQNPKTQQFV